MKLKQIWFETKEWITLLIFILGGFIVALPFYLMDKWLGDEP